MLDLARAHHQAAKVFDFQMAKGTPLMQQQLPSNAIECFQAADQAFPEKDAVRGLIQQAQALFASQNRYFAAMQQGQALLKQQNYMQARACLCSGPARIPTEKDRPGRLEHGEPTGAESADESASRGGRGQSEPEPENAAEYAEPAATKSEENALYQRHERRTCCLWGPANYPLAAFQFRWL